MNPIIMERVSNVLASREDWRSAFNRLAYSPQLLRAVLPLAERLEQATQDVERANLRLAIRRAVEAQR